MADATLMEMMKEVRWKTLKLLEDVDEQQARFTPEGLHNTILWHAGHSLVVVEQLSFVANTNSKLQLPDGWFDKFSWQSVPANVTQWPALSEVVDRLKEQRERLTAFINRLSPEELNKVVGAPPRSRTFGGNIIHGLHDEANHQGEVYLLKKMWKLRK